MHVLVARMQYLPLVQQIQYIYIDSQKLNATSSVTKLQHAHCRYIVDTKIVAIWALKFASSDTLGNQMMLFIHSVSVDVP